MKTEKHIVNVKKLMAGFIFEYLTNEFEYRKAKKMEHKKGATKIFSYHMCKEIADEFFDSIEKNLIDGERLNLPSIGILEKVKYNKTNCHNPKTGEKVAFSSKDKLKFKMSNTIEFKLNQFKDVEDE